MCVDSVDVCGACEDSVPSRIFRVDSRGSLPLGWFQCMSVCGVLDNKVATIQYGDSHRSSPGGSGL